MSCVQVGQTVFFEKNLCSFVRVDTLCVNFPLIVFSFNNLSLAPVYSSCFFISSDISLSNSSLVLTYSSVSLIKSLIFSCLFCISFFPLVSISSIKFSCISTLSFKDSFFNSKVFNSSLTPRIFSFIRLFIDENILMSNKSSTTSLLLVDCNCINGTNVLDPNITI